MLNWIIGAGTAGVLALTIWLSHSAGEKAGRAGAEAKAERVARDAALRAVVRLQAQARAATAAGENHAVEVERVRTVYRTITKEIPVVLTPEVDRAFPLPNGLVRLHDAAALGRALGPAPAGQPDDASSSVTAGRFGSVIAGNYESCAVEMRKLADLQAFIRGQGGY